MYPSKIRRLFAVGALIFPLAVIAAPQYAYTVVGLSPMKSVAEGISNSGYVTGAVLESGNWKAFLYSPRKGLINLGSLLDAAGSTANAVNNAGQVVGNSSGAFLYSDGEMITLEAETANGINDAGDVVGSSQGHAILYRKGVMKDLGTLPGGNFSSANAINNHGQIAGVAGFVPPDPATQSDEHAFLYEDGVMKDLGTLGGLNSTATAINDRGQVVGMSYTNPHNTDEHRAFLHADGTMRDLGTPVAGTSSWAKGINNRGQVVGWYSSGTGRAFIYDRRHGMRDLGRMVDPASGWYIHGGYSINDQGQIVGLGCKDGQYGAVLLTPTYRDDLVATTPVDNELPPQATAGAPENPACPYG